MASVPTNISLLQPTQVHTSNISSIKAFAQSNGATPIPSNYHSFTDIDHVAVADELAASIPVIDFSLLTSDDPQIHTKAVDELAKACADWGFFMLTNHGIPESLMEDLMKKSQEFHDLPVEEKEFRDDGDPFSPIRHGTSIHPPAENVHYWRDFLKALISPQFNFPNKPPGYREVAFEYSEKITVIARKLMQRISKSLGLESSSIIDSSGFDSGLHYMVVNLYPPCPQPNLALGLPSHSDVGFLAFLIQNEIGGLQVIHEGKWINVNPIPNCLVVNIGDQLEVVSNGSYASVFHRAILNNKDTRISVVVLNGPAQDKEIGPAPQLLEKEKPLFKSIKYGDYFQVQQKSRFSEGRALDQIRNSALQ